jgi:hypothetical protein
VSAQNLGSIQMKLHFHPNVALYENGSVAFCVLASCGDGQHASTKEFSSGAAIHGAFERLELVDLALRLTIAPFLSDRVAHRVTVLHGSVGGRGLLISLHRYGRRTYSGRPSSSIRFSALTAIATSVARR